MKKYFSPGLYIMLLVTVLSYILFSIDSQLAFKLYTTGIFGWIRKALNQLSFTLVCLLWLLLIFSYFRYRKSQGAPLSLFRWIKFLFEPVIWCAILFYWFWGFNYMAPRAESFILKEWSPPAKEQIIEAFQEHTIRLNSLRDSLTERHDTSTWSILDQYSRHWDSSVQVVLRDAGYSIKGRAKLTAMRPEGFLLRTGTAGFYNFLLARPTIDPALHNLQVPNTSLHELAHAYGVASEASANFIAYMAGCQSKDLMTRYSVELALWRTLRSACYHVDSTAARTITSFAGPSVRNDLIEIRRRMDRYPDIFPKLRDTFYDFFLKSQGIEEGMASYDLYLPIVLAWEREKKFNTEQ